MAASRRAQVLRLYRALLRESQGFTAYGYRTYAIRRIRDAFRENKNTKESSEINALISKAKTNLEMIHRQTQEVADISLGPFIWLLFANSAPSQLLILWKRTMLEVTIGQLYSAEKLVIECPQKI
ncbi:LYR motif-containing protein 4 isoform X2 [Python bivittatus]|uniref:LYR motif-containing protein 4 isoform X2 n=1 Tax=Python bivittatus TaxID=176946 RepID=A0A9F5IXV4_PYTBI|nr:LYR motif-containing protein 4 isoform X2 [Python bivittatus]